MFKHILVPTDGSKLAGKGVKAGVRLARSLGAKVTGLYVIPPYQPRVYGEAALYYVPGMSADEYGQECLRAAKKALAAVAGEARSAGVPCRTQFLTDPQPWGGILRGARAAKCDAIVIASHGRGTVRGLLLGSQTARILAHSKLPVLVTR